MYVGLKQYGHVCVCVCVCCVHEGEQVYRLEIGLKLQTTWYAYVPYKSYLWETRWSCMAEQWSPALYRSDSQSWQSYADKDAV